MSLSSPKTGCSLFELVTDALVFVKVCDEGTSESRVFIEGG